MRNLLPSVLLAIPLLLSGCSDKAVEVEIDETREVMSADQVLRLKATSFQRFRPGENNYQYTVPKGWLKAPRTQFRVVNFSIEGALPGGEIYISESQGTLGDNVNRWRSQFGQAPIGQAEVSSLPRTVAFGSSLALVEADGTFAPGMGKPPLADWALVGVIGSSRSGVITVKMTGPRGVVAANREAFIEFCATLTIED